MHWVILFLSFLLFFFLQIYNYFFISSAPLTRELLILCFFILYYLVYNRHLRNICCSESTYDWALQMDEAHNLRQVDLKLRVQANWLAENWCVYQVVITSVSVAVLLGLKWQCCCFLIKWPWLIYFNSQCLSFLTYK